MNQRHRPANRRFPGTRRRAGAVLEVDAVEVDPLGPADGDLAVGANGYVKSVGVAREEGGGRAAAQIVRTGDDPDLVVAEFLHVYDGSEVDVASPDPVEPRIDNEPRPIHAREEVPVHIAAPGERQP